MRIGPATFRATEAGRTVDAAGAGASFRMPAGAAGTGSAAPSAAEPARGLDALLALQETAATVQDPATRDREARRHGRDLLEELAALQKALLAGGEEAGGRALARLAALLRSMPSAADPGLDGVLRSVGLRARLELARRGLEDVAAGCGSGDAIG